MKHNGVIASIVLYEPDIERLYENISAIQDQVEKVVIIINGSGCDCVISDYSRQNDFYIIQNEENKGIAFALNQALEYAYTKKYKWVLTLDQDTVVPADLVVLLLRHEYCDKIGIIAPNFVDRNYYHKSEEKKGWGFVLNCITSACLTNVDIWKRIGGFDNELFIDFVDHDYCANLVESGYAIIQDYDVKILHEIGNGKRVFFGKHSMVVLNHSAMRKYYMVRNAIYFTKKWPKLANTVSNKNEFLTLQLISIVFFENDKIRKLSAVFKGVFDSKKLIRKVKMERKLQLQQNHALLKEKENERKKEQN